MKSKIFFFTVFFPVILFSQVQSGWYWVNPKPQGHSLYSVETISSDLSVSVGANGTILRTTNNGINWMIYRYNTCRDLRKIKFVNSNTGYIIGDSSIILKSTDSGFFWNRLSYSSSNLFRDISFINEFTGYISTTGKLIKTTNGGTNFTDILIPGYSYEFYTVCFPDQNTGYCGGYLQIYKTTNGGITWTNTANFSGFSSFFFDANSGFIGGDEAIYKTVDGGLNWSVYNLTNSSNIKSIKFYSQNTGFACSSFGKVYKTINSGVNWTEITPAVPINAGYNDLSTIDNTNYFLIGSHGIIQKSINSGLSWTIFDNSFRNSLYGISFPSVNTGFIIGEKDVYNYSLLKTTNQGINWTKMSIHNSNEDYFDVFFTDNNTGFAGGSNGLICKTTNSGINWSFVNLNDGFSISDLIFVNQLTGFAGTTFPSIYKTSNGGANWLRVFYNSSASRIEKFAFPSISTGYASGFGLYKTTNGGDNWFNLNAPSVSPLNKSIFFINNNTGFLGGDGGEISKTTNGGLNWSTNITEFTQYQFLEIQFVNMNTGYIAGFSNSNINLQNIVLKTTNSGSNWESLNLPSNYVLFAMQFLNDTIGYLAGERGAIIKTNSGGEPIGIEKISNEIPNYFLLNQNYPNPFNPFTKIQFELPKKSFVKLKIFDILGREIENLVNDNLSEGVYEVNWDASNYSSGVYFYKLIAGEYEESKKMVLIK